ncbi:MAG: helix-turn-helix domain-containing protein [Anaerolineae bacterium]
MRPLDRRIVRTRRMLRDALMALIAERGFDSISVQDITERADLRRATFYLHYKSKEELLLATLAELFEGVRQQVEALPPQPALGGKTNLEMFVVIYRHIADYRALYRAILEGQGQRAVLALHPYLSRRAHPTR